MTTTTDTDLARLAELAAEPGRIRTEMIHTIDVLRCQGVTWQRIADAMGCTDRRAAQTWYSRHAAPGD